MRLTNLGKSLIEHAEVIEIIWLDKEPLDGNKEGYGMLLHIHTSRLVLRSGGDYVPVVYKSKGGARRAAERLRPDLAHTLGGII